jgi:hypothetical protein
MYKQKKENRYPAQALAIAMLVLVVSSLIGMSMYSRARKDRTLTLEERASAEALEVSDILLNNITKYTLEEVIVAINNSYFTDPDEFEGEIVLRENRDNNDITKLFMELGLLETATISELIDPLCPVGIGANEYQLTIQKADKDTVFEVRPGHVWTFPTRKVAVNSPVETDECNLKLFFSDIGDPLAGFVYTKMSCQYGANDLPESCDEYNEDMMQSYRYESAGITNPDFLDDENWNEITPGEVDPAITVDLRSNFVEVPSEIRIKALGRLGSPGIGISYELLGNSCPQGVDMYQIRATANCSEVYRGKEIVIPQRGFNILFDYVYFSGM